MFALLVACALGQASSDPVSAQRTWLFNALEADLQAKGQNDPAQLQQSREQIGRLTPSELQTLVNLYQSLKQSASPAQVRTEAVSDRDQSVVQPSDQLGLELDPRTQLPSAALLGGVGYGGGGYGGVGYGSGRFGYAGGGFGYAGGPGLGTAIYGGLPAASMFPGSYGGAPLPFAGPMGFGTFSATGPVVGYSAPFVPGGPPWPMRFGP